MLKSIFLCSMVLGASLLPSSAELDPALVKTINGLGAEDFAERKDAFNTLLLASEEKQDEILPVLLLAQEKHSEPEVRKQAGELLLEIYRRYELGLGEAHFGFTLGWFIERKKKFLTSWPMILTVDPESPAAEAKLKPGDVIVLLNGDSCDGLNSRNDLVRKLANAEPDKELKLQIRFSGAPGAFEAYQKNKVEERSITPSPRKEDEGKVDQKLFEAWLATQAKA